MSDIWDEDANICSIWSTLKLVAVKKLLEKILTQNIAIYARESVLNL